MNAHTCSRRDVVAFAEDGTSISLCHPTATRDELIDFAESLVPVP